MRLKLNKTARMGLLIVAAVIIVALVWALVSSQGSTRPMVEAISSLSPTATPVPQATLPPDDPGATVGPDDEPVPPDPGSVAQAQLKFLGDIAPQTEILSAGYNTSTGEYDFSRLFSKIKGELASDLTIASFESICVDTGVTAYSGNKSYNTPVSFLTAMKDAGIDAVTLANSHILDQGMTGVTQTIDALAGAGLGHFGAYATAGDAEQNALIDINGIKIAVLSYTDDLRDNLSTLNSAQREYAVSIMKESTIKSHIERAKEKGADVVIVCLHWGELFTRSPDSAQRTLAENLLKAGADVIIGTHPQTVQRLTNKTVTRTGGGEARGIVAYSMGNFVSEYRERYYDSSILLSITIEKDMETGKCVVLDPEYSPLWIDKFQEGGGTVFEVVPMSRYMDDQQNMTDASYTRMKAAWDEVTGQIGESAEVVK